MTRIAPRSPDSSLEVTIAEAIMSAPGWARVGITAPTEYVREEAARELARVVLEGSEKRQEVSPGQLALEL